MKTVVKLWPANVIANSYNNIQDYKNIQGMALYKNKIFQFNSVWGNVEKISL